MEAALIRNKVLRFQLYAPKSFHVDLVSFAHDLCKFPSVAIEDCCKSNNNNNISKSNNNNNADNWKFAHVQDSIEAGAAAEGVAAATTAGADDEDYYYLPPTLPVLKSAKCVVLSGSSFFQFIHLPAQSDDSTAKPPLEM